MKQRNEQLIGPRTEVSKRHSRIFLRLALLVGGAGLVSSSGFAQPPSNLAVPTATWSSGNALYEATSAVTSSQTFLVNGNAAVVFRAGSTITLSPGFDAAGSAGATFYARIGLPMLYGTLNVGTVGQAYQGSLGATGGTPPYSFSISSGSLPAGLMLNSSTGAISGTPVSVGTSTFNATVVDSSTPSPLSDTETLSISITTTSTFITAYPNPVVVSDGTGEGVATINYSAPGHSLVNVYAGSTLLCTDGTVGSCVTGKWVTNGMVFTMKDYSTGATLGSVTATVQSPVVFYANPNPILVASGDGTTTLYFNTPGVTEVTIYVNGTEFCSAVSPGSCTTGNWVSDGTSFVLKNSSTGATLATTVVSVVVQNTCN